ncbi:unnamed protein product, partial [Ilex paraguariensis]
MAGHDYGDIDVSFLYLSEFVVADSSRSIGDVYLKKPEFNREPLYAKFRLRVNHLTRPILSTEPSISVHEVQPHDQFSYLLLMAFGSILAIRKLLILCRITLT